MSRVGKKSIQIPQGVEVKIDGQKVDVKGQKGELSREIPSEIKAEIKDGNICIYPKIDLEGDKSLNARESKRIRSLWGLTRALVANMVKGVFAGFEKKLEIEGVGFRAVLSGTDNLELFVGFSHSVKIKAPKDVKFSVEKNIITVSGVNNELVGQVAATIKKVKKPEPYKGKGIRYAGEVIKKKVGKKAVATAG